MKVPEHMVAEIVDGVLYAWPRPASPHAYASTLLGAWLTTAFHELGGGMPGGWWLASEPELHFGKDVVVPDWAGWRVARMPEFPNVPFFTLAPDWICEILSPSTKRFDREKKLRVYARAAVQHAWLLDPIEKTLDVLTLRGSRWVVQAIHRDSDRIRAAPFDAIEINLAGLWLQKGNAKRARS